MKFFIGSVVISFVMLGIGIFLMFDAASSDAGEVVAVGDAPDNLVFESSTLNYYDIYAENSDTTIKFGDFSYDSEYTHLEMCKDDPRVSGITGDCGTFRGGSQFIGSLTIGAGDGGNTILETTGSGQVEIVATPVASVGGAVLALCTGCCFGPILAIVSGLKAFKSDRSREVFVLSDYQGMGYSQIMNLNNLSQTEEIQPRPKLRNLETPAVSKSWEQFEMVDSQFPPATMNGMSDPHGTEWLDYEGKKYHRASGTNSNWNLYEK